MTFIPKALKRKEERDRKHRSVFREYLENRIRKFQERLDTDEFENEDEAVAMTQHVQRLRKIIDELDRADMQGQGLTKPAM